MNCRVWKVAAAAALVVSIALPADAGVWGAKARSCPKLETKLAALEANPATNPLRLERFRRRVADKCVALNEIQILGSHNSYHVQPRPALLAALLSLSPQFQAWEYTHLPLYQQFETQNVRQIELDVFADPDGGLYNERPVLTLIGDDPVSNIPALLQPGLKVFHVQDLDFETTCHTFIQCLQHVKAWSDANPKHLPITILVEAKDEAIPDPVNLGFVIPLPIDAAALDQIDADIRAVFPAKQLITPDRVRRKLPSLEEAILTLGWPRLGVLRGKVMFMLDNGGTIRDTYVAGHPALAGRVLFTDSPSGTPEAGFRKMNDPLPNPGVIADQIAAGYVVRTRADYDTVHARANDTTQRDAALASGAQWVSTDYPVANPAFSPYAVQVGDGPARCNPINAPPGCRDAGLE